jgi:uncharacterized protein with HEPN domain
MPISGWISSRRLSGVKRDDLFLRHIHDEAQFLRQICTGLTYEELLADPIRQRAIIRSIEVIGEAAKNVSDAKKAQYPDIPWRLIAGARDKLIHAYFNVDWGIVWNILQNEIPLLEPRVRSIIDELDSGTRDPN